MAVPPGISMIAASRSTPKWRQRYAHPRKSRERSGSRAPSAQQIGTSSNLSLFVPVTRRPEAWPTVLARRKFPPAYFRISNGLLQRATLSFKLGDLTCRFRRSLARIDLSLAQPPWSASCHFLLRKVACTKPGVVRSCDYGKLERRPARRGRWILKLSQLLDHDSLSLSWN